MWNEPAASTDGSAPAETPEQPEPAYESKQDEPSGLDPRAADPRRLGAPAAAADEEDADPLASLPADFAAFSLTQTHPRSGDAKAEPFEQQRQYKTRMCIYGDKCPYGPGRCFFAHDESEFEAAAGALVAARVQDEALPRAPRSAPFMRTAAASTRTRSAGRRPIARDSLDTTDAGRGAPVLAAAAGEDAGQEVQDAHVPLRRGHVPLRRELLLRAQRRSLPRGKINSSRRRREKRVGPRAGGAPAARARRAAGRADRRRQPARAAPRPPRQRQRLGGRVRGAQAAGPARAGRSFAAQAPVLLAPTAPPPPRCLSPPPPDAYMLPAMAMPPRVVPRPPAYAPQPPYAAVPGPPRGYGVPQLLPRGYGVPPPPYASVPRPRGRRILGTGRRDCGAAARAAGPRDGSHTAAAAAAVRVRARRRASQLSGRSGCRASFGRLVSARLRSPRCARRYLARIRAAAALRSTAAAARRPPRERPHHMSGEDDYVSPHES